MELIATAILAALAKLAEPLIRDSYDALKGAITKRFGKQSGVVDAMEKLEEKPDSNARKDVLREEIATANVASDQDILKAARDLLEQIKLQPGGEKIIQQAVTQTTTGDHNISTGIGNITITRS